MTMDVDILISKFDLKDLETNIKKARSKINENEVVFNISWKLRSDLEYYIALIKLEIEKQIDFENVFKTLRMKKEDKERNKLLDLIEENILQIQKPNKNLQELLNTMWKARELLTLLIREVEPNKKK
jgi:hypothetical protein